MEREPFNQPNNTEEESSFEDDFDKEQIVEKTSFDQLEGGSLFADKLKEKETEEKTSDELVSKVLNPKFGQQIKNWGIRFGKDFLKGYDRLTKTAIWGGEEIKTKEELLSVPADSAGSAFHPDSKAYDYLTWLEYKKQSPEKTAAMEKVAENATKEYTKTHTDGLEAEGLKAVEKYDKNIAEMSNKVLTETDIIQLEKGYQITYNEIPVISLKKDYIDNKIEEFSLETDPIKQKELLNELAIHLSKRAMKKNLIPTLIGEKGEERINLEMKIREGLEKKLSDFLEEAINQKKEGKGKREAEAEAEKKATEAEAEKQRLVKERKKSFKKISETKKEEQRIKAEEEIKTEEALEEEKDPLSEMTDKEYKNYTKRIYKEEELRQREKRKAEEAAIIENFRAEADEKKALDKIFEDEAEAEKQQSEEKEEKEAEEQKLEQEEKEGEGPKEEAKAEDAGQVPEKEARVKKEKETLLENGIRSIDIREQEDESEEKAYWLHINGINVDISIETDIYKQLFYDFLGNEQLRIKAENDLTTDILFDLLNKGYKWPKDDYEKKEIKYIVKEYAKKFITKQLHKFIRPEYELRYILSTIELLSVKLLNTNIASKKFGELTKEFQLTLDRLTNAEQIEIKQKSIYIANAIQKANQIMLHKKIIISDDNMRELPKMD